MNTRTFILKSKPGINSGVTPIRQKSANWYLPPGVTLNGNATPVQANVVLFPFQADQNMQLTALGASVVTPQAASNAQFAIYANDGTINQPTGAPLATTASVATTAAGPVSQTLNATLSLVKGVTYWLAINTDIAGLVFYGLSGHSNLAKQIGDATLVNLLGTATLLYGYKIAQAFNTWPTFTGGSVFTRQPGSVVPGIAFKAL